MKTCPTCDTRFDERERAKAGADATSDVLARIKYCSEKCARKAENRRYYAAHRPTIIKRVKRNTRLASPRKVGYPAGRPRKSAK